jgi:DNA-binding CsgD family transcriptional regulator
MNFFGSYRLIFNSLFILSIFILYACSNPIDKKESSKTEISSKEKYANIDSLKKVLEEGNYKLTIKKGIGMFTTYKKGKDSLGVSSACELIAKAYYFQQNIDSAIYYWKTGLSYVPKNNQDLRATMTTNLGSAYMFKGYQRTAISYFLEARKIFKNKKIQSDNYWINYLNIGVCYMEIGEYGMADSYFSNIPFVSNDALDVIVPINIAKLAGLQSDKKRFNNYIKVALKNQKHASFYVPILKEVHLEFTEKLGSYLELYTVYEEYKKEYGLIGTSFDLYLWKASIKLGNPFSGINELKQLQGSIKNSDYFLLENYYGVLADWHVSKNDFKNAYTAKGLKDFCEQQSEQKDVKDKLYDFTLLAKRNELLDHIKSQEQLNNVQSIQLKNRSLTLYFVSIIFVLLVITSFLILVNQQRKNKLNKKVLTIQELELKLAKEQQIKLEKSIEFKDKKLESILETVGKIAILKNQLDLFFNIMEKKQDLGKESKTLVKDAKLDFNLFFNNYQELAVLSNLVGSHSTKITLIKEKYSALKENEFRVLLLIIQNYTSKEMAMLLSCTEKNIEYYRTQIRKRLNIPKNQNILEFIDLENE